MAKLSSTDIYGDLYVDGIISGVLSGSVSNNLKIQLNSGTTEGTNQFTFNGSAAKTINITPSSIGALPLSGGTMTGKITTPNNSQGITIGDDATLCDRNIADHIVIEGSTAANGGITFGSGKDTNIYRGGANILKTDDTMNAVGGFQWNGQSLDNRYAAYSHGTHLTLGTGASNAAAGNHTHNAIESRGNVSCETGANVRPAVMGLSMAQVYSNGYPTTYGNVISLRGAGDGQILVGWAGTSGAHAPMYVRSRRDTTDADWSGWAQVYTSANPQTTMNGLSLWRGTQAEYNAISSKSSTTLYFITG